MRSGPPPTPDQRLERLERQMQQVQRQLFPKGRPADTAGFSDEPAATQSSVLTLDQRLDSLERQVADMLRQTEENGNRLQSLQGDLGKMRTDQEQRISTLEQRMNDAASGGPGGGRPWRSRSRPGVAAQAPKPQKPIADDRLRRRRGHQPNRAGDPGEDAYTAGFRLWEAGQFDAAITALRPSPRPIPSIAGRAMRTTSSAGRCSTKASRAPRPRRCSPIIATTRRASARPTACFISGQALMKLGQPGQACKAYAELDAVYGAKIRADLKKLETDAKAQAQCS